MVSRTWRIPHWHASKFPEAKGQTLDQYLKKHDITTFRGISKCPESIRKQVTVKTYRLLKLKAERLKRVVGHYTTRSGRRYSKFQGNIIYVPYWKRGRAYELWYDVYQMKITKVPDWYKEIK